MNCNNCGSENVLNAVFCQSCGAEMPSNSSDFSLELDFSNVDSSSEQEGSKLSKDQEETTKLAEPTLDLNKIYTNPNVRNKRNQSATVNSGYQANKVIGMYTNPNANIIIMGDLNDHPTDRSVLEVLKAQTKFDKIKPKKLYNTSYYLEHEKNLGTHKYNGQWGILDQIIVSGGLMDTTSSISCTLDDSHIFNADFLLEPDEKYTGKRVNRTYIGFKFHGGYSDHLPIYIDLKINKEE